MSITECPGCGKFWALPVGCQSSEWHAAGAGSQSRDSLAGTNPRSALGFPAALVNPQPPEDGPEAPGAGGASRKWPQTALTVCHCQAAAVKPPRRICSARNQRNTFPTPSE